MATPSVCRCIRPCAPIWPVHASAFLPGLSSLDSSGPREPSSTSYSLTSAREIRTAITRGRGYATAVRRSPDGFRPLRAERVFAANSADLSRWVPERSHSDLTTRNGSSTAFRVRSATWRNIYRPKRPAHPYRIASGAL
jgi:hypothetical protein